MDEEALARFERLLERRPFHDAAFDEMVKSFAARGELPKLVEAYEAKVAALPEELAPRVILTRLQLRAGNAERAAELAEKIELPADSRDGSALLILRASIAERLGTIEEAQELLSQALQSEPTIARKMDLAEALADLHLRAGSKERAAAVLTGLTASFPTEYLHRKRIADALAQRGLNEAAVGEYRSLLDLVGDHAERRCEVLRQLGQTQERLGRTDEAIASYTEAMHLLADDHWLQRELQDRVVGLYRASGRLQELVAYCRTEVERSPTQVAMRSLLAEVLAASGDVDGAKDVLAEAVELFPADRSLSERRIALLDRSGDVDGVFAEYERIIAEHPEDLELYIAYGESLVRHERRDAARNQWRHVLGNELADATTAQRLAQIFESHEMTEDAAECYERAIALAPGRPDAYLALSRLRRAAGDEDAALAVLERMSAANAEDAGIQSELAGALLGFGRIDEALAAIERACELAPENVRFQSARADLLVRAGRLDDALRVRRETIDLIRNPVEQAQAISALVSAYASAGKLDELKAAEEAALAAGEDPVRLLMLARAADFERDFAAARSWLERLLALDPAHEEARRQIARLHEAVGDVDAAVQSYQTLIDQHPARARQYYQAIVDSMLAYGDRAGAVRTLERMRQEAGGNVTVLTSVAEQLVRLEELDEGLACYEESLRLQPGRYDVQLAYGKALQQAGRLEDALAAFRDAAMQTSDRETATEALARLHEVAGDLGVVDDLLDELEGRVQQNPDETVVAATVARLLIQEYEYARAMDLIETVLRARPREAELLIVRAELLRRMARFDEALAAYRDILPLPNVDRDLVLGEMGKACFEAGRVDEARRHWRQISHKMYAGTLLRNNGLLDEAIEVLREGIRLKPDDRGLYRNLIETLQSAGQEDEALKAARRLLDLEPTNAANIRQLAKAYLDRGDRATAAEIAGRLFSADVSETTPVGGRTPSRQPGVSSVAAALAGGMYGSAGPTNLDAAVQFFRENGLMGELEGIIEAQLETQPANALLRLTSVGLYSEAFAKPARALELLGELEALEFPVEYQAWLGQSSQRDYFRIMRYELIGRKPALRDARLTELNGREELSRDELLELAMIRQSQGNLEDSIALLTRAVEADAGDVLALSALTDALVRAERFADAEPHALRLTDLMKAEYERLQGEMAERVRRDFVRTLPVQLQLRVTDGLIADIAHKWTLGEGLAQNVTGTMRVMGYLRARLTLATIYAETDRIDQARAIWQDVVPRNPADSEGWTTLASVVQLYDQEDLAFEYYWNAMQASKRLAADPLLQRVFGDTMTRYWYGAQAKPIDTAFNKIVEAFQSRDRLIELYDFLRDSGQGLRAGWIAEQYGLQARLEAFYSQRVKEAAARFAEADDPLAASPAYFVEVCKLAELRDGRGDWDSAKQAYAAYLEDSPDELGLLLTLSDAAEAQGELDEAIGWEERAIECKRRLSRKAQAWSMREIYVTPRLPKLLESRIDRWSWPQRWSDSAGRWWGRSNGRESLEPAASWLRIARLRLAQDNPIAAGEAMERALATGGPGGNISAEVLEEIRQRRLVEQMLPVLRAMAVQAPDDEGVQLAFGESLEANGRGEVAAEVYQRLLRHGVSDIGVLTQVQQRLSALAPEGEGVGSDTLATLEASVQASPEDMSERLRLARAYFYSLRVDDALAELEQVRAKAPHLEGVDDLRLEILTLRGDPAALIEALQERVRRASADHERSTARDRLARALLEAGRTDEALEQLKQGADPSRPDSYQRIGMLLQYFGRHDEAIEQFKLAGKSQQYAYGAGQTGNMLAGAYIAKGDVDKAADEILASVQEQLRQATQYGGMYAMFGGGQDDPFQPFVTLFILEPELEEVVRAKLAAMREGNEQDAALTKLLMQFDRFVGANERADQLLQQVVDRSAADQQSITLMIDRAAGRGDYDEAIRLAEQFIAQQPKPEAPPGMPPQYAGMMVLMSPRNTMVCKLGDLYWKQGQEEKAFETYRRIVDEEIDETRLAYATICVLRGRLEEASTIVQSTLDNQQVKSPQLLQFRAVIAALQDEPRAAFDHLATVASMSQGGGDDDPFAMRRGGGGAIAQVVTVARAAGLIEPLIEFLRGRIEKSPSDWQLRATLASVLKDAGRREDAAAVLDQAAERPALRLSALETKLAWQAGAVDPASLVPLYEELITLSEQSNADAGSRNRYGSGDPAASYRDALGDLLWKLGRHDEAVARWTERMDMKDPSSQIGLSRKYLEREAYAEAKACLQAALKLDPENAGAHEAMARLCYQAGDLPGMLDHLRVVFEQEQSEGDDQYGRYGGADFDGNGERCAWARALAADPQIQTTIAAMPEAERASARLMIAAWTGEWDAAEEILRTLRESSPYDPKVWTLLVQCFDRRGAWKEAAAALQQLRRLNETTLPDHRRQLDLVLAGKQIRQAASGTQQSPGASAAGGAAGYAAFYPGYAYGRYGAADSSTQQLAIIHSRLGDFATAERLYLSGRMQADALAPLAQIMWEQGASKRALELMRLSAAMFSNTYAVVQYADMLAESGEVEQAIKLLSRAYAYSEPVSDDAYGSMYARYFGYGADDSAGVDSGEQATFADGMHSLLTRYGRLEACLESLRAHLSEDPADLPSRRLLLSLTMRDGRWDDVRSSLAEWLALNPRDPSSLGLAFQAYVQLGDWKSATSALARLREAEPDRGVDWMLREAFVALAEGDGERVAAALAPALGGQRSLQPDEMLRVGTALACAGRYKELCDLLAAGRRDDDGGDATVLLLAALEAQQRWQEAADLSLDQFRREEDVVDGGVWWYEQFRRAARSAQAEGEEVLDLPPAGRVLQTLALNGAEPARTLAASLIAEHPDDPDLRRAAVFAAWRGGQWDEALKANDDLLAWLKPRRMDLWIRPAPLSLSKRANRYLAQTKASGMDTQAVLGMSMQYESILEQMLSSDEEPTARTYESLYQAHQRYRGRLLRLTGDVDGYREHMLAKATEVAQVEPERPYYDQRYGASGEPVDWRESVRAMLLERGRFEEFIARCEALGARLPIEAYGDLAEAHAALGHAQEAAAWRSRLADLQLTALLAADQPSLSDGRSYSWWWYRSGAGEEDAVRGRLRQVRLPKHEEAPPPRGLLGYGLLDPAFESRLVAAADSAGPGWESTRLLDAVVQLHLRQDRPAEVIALLERVHEGGDLVQSPHLDAYLSACAATGDEERFERTLAAVEAFSPRLKTETDLLRMAFARLSGDTASADAIEAECRQRCRSDRPNPMMPDDGFCAVLRGVLRDAPAWTGADQQASWHGTRRDSQLHLLAGGLPTVARLAAALGVDYDAESGREDLSLETMRDVYDRFGLDADALRIVEMEMAAEDLPDRERADLLEAKANLLNDLGRPEEARAALTPVSARLESLMDSPSPAPEVVQQVITLWESEQLGNDPARALEILHEAGQRDPLVDAGGVIEAGLLFRLGRYEDAWESYRQCFDEGAIRYTDTTAVLRAGIAGAKAGDEAAQRFLRLGLWRNPFDELAATAKELLQ